MYRSYFWKRGHYLDQYTQAPEWRLLSSWGRLNGGAPKPDKRTENGSGGEDFNAWQKRRIDDLRQLEEFGRLIDEDPYKVLFGRRLPESRPEPKTKQDKTKSDGRVAVPGAGSKKPDSATNSVRTTQTTPKVSATASFTDSDDFVIDPITLRKVPVQADSKRSTTIPATRSAKSFDIPVKTCNRTSDLSSSSQSTDQEKDERVTRETAQDVRPAWLVREGFSKSEGDRGQLPSTTCASPSQLENALDRYQKKPRFIAGEETKNTNRLIYDPKENQDEDVDLLTASDIRAARNRLSKKQRGTTKEKEDQRQLLENNYNKRPQELEKRLEEELAAKKVRAEQTLMKELREIAEEQRKRDAIRAAHEEEVAAHKAAMEAHEMHRNEESNTSLNFRAQQLQQAEGDMATNVHEFATRDRWYKRKAPHAIAVAEQKLLQASKDKALVREVRGIYEDMYGTIDNSHRQPTSQPRADDSEYPSDACPGTVYEQPWTANVLNDHPDIDHPGVSLTSQHSQLQGQNEEQRVQALALIGKLFSEMRENQMLLQGHRAQLLDLKTNNESQNLYQSFKAHEQRIMHNLKAAQNLFKTTFTNSSDISNGQNIDNLASEAEVHAPKEPASSSDGDDSAPVTMYKILAHDPSSGKVVTTKATNLTGPLAGEAPTISEALLRLENPAKFLPHFAALQNAEYEIAAASPHLLIFKKIRQLKPVSEEKTFPPPTGEFWRYPNPIDGTTTQIGNFASPTGFVNYDPPFPEPEVRAQEEAAEVQGKVKDKVRRQEEVFSGSSRRPWHDEYERGMSNKARTKKKHRRALQRRKTVKRMLVVGLLTAGGCYAVGVASEFFRL